MTPIVLTALFAVLGGLLLAVAHRCSASGPGVAAELSVSRATASCPGCNGTDSCV